MIFRNPYGYLIKNFKLIHLFLAGLYIYLVIKVNSILQYFNHFIDGAASKLDAISLVDNFYLIPVFLSIVICAIVYALMRYKKKPRLLYILLIFLYIIVSVMIIFSYRGLNTIYFSVLDTKTLRLYRDLLNILILFQYASVIFVLFRGLGFDIKRFNFVNDLEDLHLDEKDEEEIELTLGGTESTQRRFFRRIREFKYYYLENKAFISIVFVVILVAIFGTLLFHNEVVAKEYKEGDSFSTDEYQFRVLNSFVTNRDINNNTIVQSDTSFVVVRLSLGTNREKRKFNTSNLVLLVNHHGYSSNSRFSSNFLDLGYGYKGELISNRETYLFIYNIDNSDIHGKMKLKYADDKVVQLNPVYLDETSNKANFQVGQKIDWSKSIFGDGYFLISSYDIKKEFNYSYQYDVMGKMNSSSLTLSRENSVILNLVLDYQLPFDSTVYAFLSNLGSLRYKVGNEEFVSSVFIDKTPGSYKDGLYLAVDEKVAEASSVWFEISVRNYKYTYKLK